MTLVSGVDGVLVGFVHDSRWLNFECGAGQLSERIGERVPLEGSLAGLALQKGETLRCDDAQLDPRVEGDFCRVSRVRSLVAVPLWRGHETVGALCVSSCRAHAFDERDAATLTSLAGFISAVIMVAVDLASATDALLARTEAARPGAPADHIDDRAAEERFVANVLIAGTLGRLQSKSRMDRCLRGRGLTHAFQPVFDITGGECCAVEALARFSGQPKRSPDIWFAEAHEIGVGVELEIVSVKQALRSLPQLASGIALCVNAGPEALMTAEFLELLETSQPWRVVVELTEETRVDDYPRLSGALKLLRSMGARLAIDDTGAGFASLAHILKLAPDFIKLDRELTSGIDRDPVRKALATALVSFASGLGAEIIAEGIETAAELEVLRGLGIRYGQGFYLCRPTSTDAIPRCLSPKTLLSAVSRAS